MRCLFHSEDHVLARIHEHLLLIAGQTSPTREQLAALVEIAFWASLEVNEGRTTRVCIAWLAPDKNLERTAFAEPVPYDALQVAKLAPAAPQDGCLAVSAGPDGLRVWGFERARPAPELGTVVLDVWEPGIVRVGLGPYPTFAVLTGRSNAIIQGTGSNLPQYLRTILTRNISAASAHDAQASRREFRAIADLARMIVAHGHGGIVLIVPEETGGWEESLCPFAYRFATADTSIRDAIHRKLDQERGKADMIQRLFSEETAEAFEADLLSTLAPLPADVGKSVRAVAALAGADGAIVMTRDWAVLGFGAKIAVRSSTLPHAVVFRPVPGHHNLVSASFEDLGGTRHQASARFVDAHRDAVALVISQDRRMSVIHWDEANGALCVLRNAEWWV